VSKANKRERQRQNRELAKVERDRLIKRDRRMRTFRSLLFVLIPVAIIFVIIYFVSGNDDDSKVSASDSAVSKINCRDVPKSTKIPKKDTSQTAPAMTIDPAKTYTATMDTSCGTITIALDPKVAPIATNNFVSLARSGFYDGLPFHRAAKGFVIQGGDPAGDGSGGPGYTVVGEVPTDSYPVGSLAAAKSGGAPAGDFGSQFFIVTGKNGAQLPNDYARFGKVTKGLVVAKKIESLATKPAEGATAGDGPPTQKVIIDSVNITEG
jgi:peptidyl-prolyl cis-trans isomerase B (cyclophilin B)